MATSKSKREQAVTLFEIIDESIREHGLRTTKAALNNVAMDPTGATDPQAAQSYADSLRRQCRDFGIQRDVIQWGQLVMAKFRRSHSMSELISDLKRQYAPQLEL